MFRANKLKNFSFFFRKTMSESSKTDFYVQGREGKLDRKYSEYKKLSLLSGPALGRALNDQEASSLIDVWNKDQRTPCPAFNREL